jgi:hypothetical protein
MDEHPFGHVRLGEDPQEFLHVGTGEPDRRQWAMQFEVAARAFIHRLSAVPAALARFGLEAVAAVDGPVAAWFEREVRNASTGRTDGVKRLAYSALRLLALSCATTVRAALRRRCEPARCMELLLAGRKGEFSAAFDAGQVLVFVHA